MRLHRFFVSEEIGNEMTTIVKDEKLIKQWRNVFRYTTGSRVVLFDGTGAEYLALIASINPNRVELQILEKIEKKNEEKMKTRDICLFMAVIKNNNFDFVLQKAAEIGVNKIIPIISDRVIKKNVNIERSRRILVEACEQSGRMDVVEIEEPQDLRKALESFNKQVGKIVICQMESPSWSKVMTKKLLNGKDKIAFVVGPEGGWSPTELEYFKEKKFLLLGIGKYTLRAETAAIGILSLALLQ